MTDPSVPGEALLARNNNLRRFTIAAVLTLAVAVAAWAIVYGDRWSSHVHDGTHTEVAAPSTSRP